MINVSTKILGSTTVFNIDNNNKCYYINEKNILSMSTKSITLYRHGLKMIRVEFGENQTNHLGVV